MAHSEREAAYHESCIRGYHIYQEVWMAAVGEVIFYEREPHNSHDLSILARTIACDGIDCNKGPLGLGRPSFGLK